MKKDMNYRHYRWNSVQNNGNEIETAKHLEKANAVSDQFPNQFLLQPTSKVDETKRNKRVKTETKRSGRGGRGASVIEESNGQRQ